MRKKLHTTQNLLRCCLAFSMLMPLSLSAQLQTPEDNAGFKLPGYLDNVVPPSPTAAQIVKYADTPVSYSLGLPDITIPIYTIKTRELELPITLTYHASGIKVDEIPGPVGLGWSLNAGGAVTKTVVGLADDSWYSLDNNPNTFDSSHVYNRNEIIQSNMKNYINDVIRNRSDSYYDKYNYSYNGNSGSFMLVTDNVGDAPKVLKTTLNDDIINFSMVSGPQQRKETFDIRDPYGNIYSFEEIETVEFRSGQLVDFLQTSSTNYITTSSAYLSDIVSADKTDVISFTYENGGEWIQYPISHTISSHSIISSTADGPQKPWGDPNTSGNNSRTNLVQRIYKDCKYVASIQFANGGLIEFIYVDDGKRINNKGLDIVFKTSDNIPKRLSEIKIWENNTLIKVFKMQNGYFSDDRYMLRGIDVVSGDGDATVYDSYTFNYYGTPGGNRPIICAQDLFGYYNGKNDNTTLSYLRFFPSDRDHSAKRAYNFECAKSYALSDIITKRGNTRKNRTHFEYEPNKHIFNKANGRLVTTNSIGNVIINPDDSYDDHYPDANDNYQDYDPPIIDDVPITSIDSVCIGLRIKHIDTYDAETPIKRRQFTYNESGCTIDFSIIDQTCYLSRSQTYSNPTTINERGETVYNWTCVTADQTLTLSTNSVLPGASPENAKVYYNHIIEDIIDLKRITDTVRVEYKYDCSDSQADIRYDIDSFRIRDSNAYINSFPLIGHESWWTYVAIPDFILRVRYNGQVQRANASDIRFYFMKKKPTFSNLINKIIYKTHGGKFIKVEEEINEYKKFNTELIRTGLYVNNIMSWGEIVDRWGNWEDKYRNRIHNLPNDCYFFDVYEEVSLWKLVSSKKVKYFCDGALGYEVGDYVGDNAHQFVIGSDVGFSSGVGIGVRTKIDSTYYNYSRPYGSLIVGGGSTGTGSTGGSTDGTQGTGNVDAGVVGPPYPLLTNLTTFQPKTVTRYVDGDVYRHEYKYAADFAATGNVYQAMKDANNIYTVVEESVTKNGGDVVSLRNNFKTGNVTNSAGNTVSAVLLSERVRNVNGLQTGQYKIMNHDIYGNPACVSVDGKSPTCYIWGHDGKYPLAEIKNATYAQVIGVLSQATLNSIASGSSDLTAQQTSTLQLHLPDALITFYTYKPMNGITSVTDPSGRTTTFHYDAAGRLNAIKDADGNLVETYEFKNF